HRPGRERAGTVPRRGDHGRDRGGRGGGRGAHRGPRRRGAARRPLARAVPPRPRRSRPPPALRPRHAPRPSGAGGLGRRGRGGHRGVPLRGGHPRRGPHRARGAAREGSALPQGRHPRRDGDVPGPDLRRRHALPGQRREHPPRRGPRRRATPPRPPPDRRRPRRDPRPPSTTRGPPMTTALPDPVRTLAYLDGGFVPAVSGATFESIDPATGRKLADIAAGDAQDVDRAVASARAAFDSGVWSRMHPSERREILLRLVALLEENLEDLALTEAIDAGKPLTDC